MTREDEKSTYFPALLPLSKTHLALRVFAKPAEEIMNGLAFIVVPVENEHVLHLYEMHHSHGAHAARNVDASRSGTRARFQEVMLRIHVTKLFRKFYDEKKLLIAPEGGIRE